jgi:hypothetical protein
MKKLKFLNSISLGLIPILLVIVYVVKNFYLTIPLFMIGMILQVLIHQERKKIGTQGSFLKDKVGTVIVSLVLIVYFFVKNGKRALTIVSPLDYHNNQN